MQNWARVDELKNWQYCHLWHPKGENECWNWKDIQEYTQQELADSLTLFNPGQIQFWVVEEFVLLMNNLSKAAVFMMLWCHWQEERSTGMGRCLEWCILQERDGIWLALSGPSSLPMTSYLFRQKLADGFCKSWMFYDRWKVSCLHLKLAMRLN
jgi:hypothetical protein